MLTNHERQTVKPLLEDGKNKEAYNLLKEMGASDEAIFTHIYHHFCWPMMERANPLNQFFGHTPPSYIFEKRDPQVSDEVMEALLAKGDFKGDFIGELSMEMVVLDKKIKITLEADSKMREKSNDWIQGKKHKWKITSECEAGKLEANLYDSFCKMTDVKSLIMPIARGLAFEQFSKYANVYLAQ